MRIRSRLLLLAISAWILLAAAAPAAFAQDIFVTPVADAPFSAQVQVKRSVVQPDGRLMELKTMRSIARDSTGRIHNEARTLVPALSSATPEVVRIHLYDPLSRTNAFLTPRDRTYRTNVVAHAPSTEPPDLYASPAGAKLPASQFAAEEDLGDRKMEGVSVHGVRKTQAIPAESSGLGKEIVVTDEYWYSSDLHMNLEVLHTDPRTGSVQMTVTNLERAEPGAAWFEIPEDYEPVSRGRIIQR